MHVTILWFSVFCCAKIVKTILYALLIIIKITFVNVYAKRRHLKTNQIWLCLIIKPENLVITIFIHLHTYIVHFEQLLSLFCKTFQMKVHEILYIDNINEHILLYWIVWHIYISMKELV